MAKKKSKHVTYKIEYLPPNDAFAAAECWVIYRNGKFIEFYTSRLEAIISVIDMMNADVAQ